MTVFKKKIFQAIQFNHYNQMQLHQEKKFVRINGPVVFADCEPFAQHIFAFNCGYFNYDFWF
jgi:hypothetical protein